jgi:hypothetical protein
MWIVEDLISINKTGSFLDGPCSSPGSKLESGNERCVCAHYRIPCILNANTVLQLESKVRGLAQRIPIGCCYEGPQLLVQCQLININKLASGEEQGPTN